MVRIRNRQPTQEQIEQFANAAESVEVSSEKPKRAKKFKRVTFSLTEHEDQLVDELSLKVRTFRCNRSQVVKAALALLADLDETSLIQLLEKQKES